MSRHLVPVRNRPHPLWADINWEDVCNRRLVGQSDPFASSPLSYNLVIPNIYYAYAYLAARQLWRPRVAHATRGLVRLALAMSNKKTFMFYQTIFAAGWRLGRIKHWDAAPQSWLRATPSHQQKRIRCDTSTFVHVHRSRTGVVLATELARTDVLESSELT